MRPDERVIHVMTLDGVCSLTVHTPRGYEFDKCSPGPYNHANDCATILVRVKMTGGLAHDRVKV